MKYFSDNKLWCSQHKDATSFIGSLENTNQIVAIFEKKIHVRSLLKDKLLQPV